MKHFKSVFNKSISLSLNEELDIQLLGLFEIVKHDDDNRHTKLYY